MKPQLIIKTINDDLKSLEEFERENSDNELLLKYPTVYIHNWESTGKYEVYIGETNNIIKRTKEHFEKRNDTHYWSHSLQKTSAKLYIIANSHFNKSMTMDVENRLMLYMSSIGTVSRVHNLRSNPQMKYYPDYEFDGIFSRMWNWLRKDNKHLFPSEIEVKESALYKASPLHRLNPEQLEVKDIILDKINKSLLNTKTHELIFVQGEAGTGKTVLNSAIFYDLFCNSEEKQEDFNIFLLVNHYEQLSLYQQIAEKLGIPRNHVLKPTTFIHRHNSSDKIADVVFVDEAHLLLTRGKQSYRGKNQLFDIIDRSKVTVVMFDINQILNTEQYWEKDVLEQLINTAICNSNYLKLTTQMRIDASDETRRWIDSFTNEDKLGVIPKDDKYEIKIYDDVKCLERDIKKKAANPDTCLSRLVATYDWEYSSARDDNGKPWEVVIGDWHKAWNYGLSNNLTKEEKKRIKKLSWAEQPHTIDEIGSTYTIQGFDLNYVGVILGPSVKYRHGKIIHDPSQSFNERATSQRTLSDGSKIELGEVLLRHEIRVLMTRGTQGLYIYACDRELRNALLSSSKRTITDWLNAEMAANIHFGTNN